MRRLNEIWQMNDAAKKIRFHYLHKKFHFPHRNTLKDFLLKQFKKEGKRVESINYIFCDDDYLLQINKQYLNHNLLTDIITFELSPKSHPLISDIYISIERVRENAKLYGSTNSNELLRVMFHGALHLVGFSDKNRAQEVIMREKENEYLSRYKFHVERRNA